MARRAGVPGPLVDVHVPLQPIIGLKLLVAHMGISAPPDPHPELHMEQFQPPLAHQLETLHPA